MQADAEVAREQLLRAYEEKRYTLAEMREVFFDNDIAMGTLQAKLNGNAPIAGSNRRTIRLFAAALAKIEAENCEECSLYRDIARRAVGLSSDDEVPPLSQHFFGGYDMYVRETFYNARSHAAEMQDSIKKYRLQIYRCEKCATPRFCVEVRDENNETLSRTGFVFMRSQRIHLMSIGKDQLNHVLIRGHNQLDEGPLPGLVLFDRESSNSQMMFACRTALVKDGTVFAKAIADDEWGQMDHFLKNDSVPRQDGVLGAYHYARES